jgi:integrase/recombinase XerC
MWVIGAIATNVPQDMSTPLALRSRPVETFTKHAVVIQQHLSWCRLVGHRPASVRLRGEVLERFAATIPVGLEHALACHIEDWLGGLGVTASSRRTYLVQLRGFYRWALEHDIASRDPTARIPVPREPRRRPRPAELLRVERAIEYAPAPVGAWLVLAAYAGLRCCEIAVVDGGDLRDGRLVVLEGKGGHQRMIPAHPRVLDVFADRPDRGRLWDADARTVSRRGNRWLRATGAEATMHQLRHSFATRIYEATGGDLFALQILMGHQSPASTAIYVQIADHRLFDAVAAL